MNGQTYTYDQNGNLTARPGQTLTYDHENRLTQVVTGGQTITFDYDGDGNLVRRVGPEGTTLYVGAHFEVFLAAPPGAPAPLVALSSPSRTPSPCRWSSPAPVAPSKGR